MSLLIVRVSITDVVAAPVYQRAMVFELHSNHHVDLAKQIILDLLILGAKRIIARWTRETSRKFLSAQPGIRLTF